MMTFTNNQRLIYITHPSPALSEIEQTRMVLEGSCGFIQLRMKQGLNPETAEAIIALCQKQGNDTILCIDDDVELALACGASGVHLGKLDMSVREARQRACACGRGDSFLIGATANTFDDIRRAVDEGASYIGLGPFRHTETKSNLSPLLGENGYRNILQKCREAAIEIPIFAIGGIERNDITSLRSIGLDGIAVSGAILRAADPTAETQHFIQLINA